MTMMCSGRPINSSKDGIAAAARNGVMEKVHFIPVGGKCMMVFSRQALTKEQVERVVFGSNSMAVVGHIRYEASTGHYHADFCKYLPEIRPQPP